jgi:hypothetical protein
MDLEARHIAYSKVIGQLNGDKVVEMATTGGLVMIAVRKARPEVLGAGSHRAIARLIASQKQPDIKYTELAKGDYVPEEYVKDLLPRYEALTDKIRKAQGF